MEKTSFWKQVWLAKSLKWFLLAVAIIGGLISFLLFSLKVAPVGTAFLICLSAGSLILAVALFFRDGGEYVPPPRPGGGIF